GRLHDPARQDQQKAARSGARERHAGGGCYVDAPALENGGGAARQRGFGRDEGGSLARRLQRFAQEQGGDEGFLAFILGFDEGETVERACDQPGGRVGFGEDGEARGPVARGDGGGQRLVDEASTGALFRGFGFDRPGLDVARRE